MLSVMVLPRPGGNIFGENILAANLNHGRACFDGLSYQTLWMFRLALAEVLAP